jgi:hypothetical protein
MLQYGTIISIHHLRSGSGECQRATLGSTVALGGSELYRKLDALAERILGKVNGRREEMRAKCHTRHFGFACVLSLMVARVYIVIEAFPNIQELPVEAYETLSWTQIFPRL